MTTIAAKVMTTSKNICWYCEGHSNCKDINLYEGEGGYRTDNTRFRIICGNCFPQVNHQGGRSWSHIYKIKSKTEDIKPVIEFMTEQDTSEEESESDYDEEEDPSETCIICIDKYNYMETGKCCNLHDV